MVNLFILKVQGEEIMLKLSNFKRTKNALKYNDFVIFGILKRFRGYDYHIAILNNVFKIRNKMSFHLTYMAILLFPGSLLAIAFDVGYY